jgi:hypothetical protein
VGAAGLVSRIEVRLDTTTHISLELTFTLTLLFMSTGRIQVFDEVAILSYPIGYLIQHVSVLTLHLDDYHTLPFRFRCMIAHPS